MVSWTVPVGTYDLPLPSGVTFRASSLIVEKAQSNDH